MGNLMKSLLGAVMGNLMKSLFGAVRQLLGKRICQCFRKILTKKQMQIMQSSQWFDLPPELVSNIAERLGPIELLKFRCVCKDWNSASSTASVQIESKLDFEPWFLLYGEEEDHKNSFGKCQLVTESGKKFNMRLPELDGATCLASNQGWLLVFKQDSSMFFFRPFSRTKINLPKCPRISKLSDHVAAFSCPPICQDCTVCVMNHVDNNELKLNVLCRGASEWIEYSIICSQIGTLRCAAYQTHQQKFYFINHTDGLLIVDASKIGVDPKFWYHTKSVLANPIVPKSEKFLPDKNRFKKTGMKKKLGFAEDEDVSFSTCGTQRQSDGMNNFVHSETISDRNQVRDSKARQFKGVWIYPKFYQISPSDQTW